MRLSELVQQRLETQVRPERVKVAVVPMTALLGKILGAGGRECFTG